MEITPLQTSHIEEAAELFAAGFRRLRRSVPILPERLEAPAAAATSLENLLKQAAPERAGALAAVENGRLAGYLGWWIVDRFRDTPRRASYVPVTAHAVAADAAQEPAQAQRISRALYSAAARTWYEVGCQAQAVTCLADDPLLEKFWFWSGFGVLLVDAIRPALPLGLPAPRGYRIRQAGVDDAPLVAALEAEHWLHYGQPPVQMAAYAPSSAEECAGLLADPANSFWLACDNVSGKPFSYLRFEAASQGATELVASDSTVACTGAFTQPAFRGRGAAQALLDSALRRFAEQGVQRCSVDFESINPEASAFWLRFFSPVCLSVMRIPETSKEKG